MKGVILAAGEGSRISNYCSVKCLLEVGGSSLIAHNINNLLAADIDNIIVVTGKHGSEIAAHIYSLNLPASFTFVTQDTPRGIAHAVKIAVSEIGLQDFALCLADEFFISPKSYDMRKFFHSSGSCCTCGVTSGEKFENIAKNYSVSLSSDGLITALIEKPTIPVNSLKGTGFCMFKNQSIKYLDTLEPSKRSGQYELCDWISEIFTCGGKCTPFVFADREYNVNTVEELNNIRGLFSE